MTDYLDKLKATASSLDELPGPVKATAGVSQLHAAVQSEVKARSLRPTNQIHDMAAGARQMISNLMHEREHITAMRDVRISDLRSKHEERRAGSLASIERHEREIEKLRADMEGDAAGTAKLIEGQEADFAAELQVLDQMLAAQEALAASLSTDVTPRAPAKKNLAK